LVNVGFDVISVRRMSATRRTPAEGTTTLNIPLFLIPRMSKSHQIFKLRSLQTVKYGHESLRTRNQESLCWRGPTAIKQSLSSENVSSRQRRERGSREIFVIWRRYKATTSEDRRFYVWCIYNDL
jgi:hypothetical protein